MMKNNWLFLLFLVLFVSCKQATQDDQQTATDKYVVEYARFFRFIEDEHGNLQLEIQHPDTGQKMLFNPLEDNKKCVALSSTFIGMLAELSLDSFVVGVSDIQYVANSLIQKNNQLGKIIQAGYDTQLNIEKIIAAHPSVVFHSGFSPTLDRQQQMEDIGIICMPIYDWKEETPLGKAEWLKMYGFLFGKYAQADSIFSEITNKYEQIKKEVVNLPHSELLMCGNLMGGEWYSPAGNSFVAQFLKDANISYHYSDTKGTGSIALTQEQVLMDNKKAKYWINAGAKNLRELQTMNPKAVFFDAFKEGNVYCYSKNGNFYWEKSSVRPDQVLSDLVSIAHPDYVNKRKLFFYSKLEE